MTEALAAANPPPQQPLPVPASAPVPVQADNGRIFHGLFRDTQRGPVSPVVSALWNSPAAPSPTPPVPAVPVAAAANVAQPNSAQPNSTQPKPSPVDARTGGFDLFRDTVPDARALFRGG